MATEHTPSRNDEEYFACVDADRREALRAKVDAEHGGFVTNLLNIFK